MHTAEHGLCRNGGTFGWALRKLRFLRLVLLNSGGIVTSLVAL